MADWSAERVSGEMTLGPLAGWLKLDNLKGFLVVLSEIVGYRFDSMDWDAVCAGIEAGREGWFEYSLEGNLSIRVLISREVDEGTVDLKIAVPVGGLCIAERIQTAWMIFNRFEVDSEVEIYE